MHYPTLLTALSVLLAFTTAAPVPAPQSQVGGAISSPGDGLSAGSSEAPQGPDSNAGEAAAMSGQLQPSWQAPANPSNGLSSIFKRQISAGQPNALLQSPETPAIAEGELPGGPVSPPNPPSGLQPPAAGGPVTLPQPDGPNAAGGAAPQGPDGNTGGGEALPPNPPTGPQLPPLPPSMSYGPEITDPLTILRR